MGDPFFLRKGSVLHDLKELEEALKIMDDEEFSHHVNTERNDFADWAENSLNKKKTAERMRKAKTREELISSIKKRTIRPPPERKEEKAPSAKKKRAEKQKTERQLQLEEHEKKEEEPKKILKTETPKAQKKTSEEISAAELEEKRRLLLGEEAARQPRGQEPFVKVHELNTQAPHHFIIKEFLLGAIFGLILGLILMGALIQLGIVNY